MNNSEIYNLLINLSYVIFKDNIIKEISCKNSIYCMGNRCYSNICYMDK